MADKTHKMFMCNSSRSTTTPHHTTHHTSHITPHHTTSDHNTDSCSHIMFFQHINNVFRGNNTPTSTARILESIIHPTSTLECYWKSGIEQVTPIIWFVFNGLLDPFFGICKWPTMIPELI
ncbi:hypothetical protein VP01_589g1 [Puccinia sorghi]|uniref:Uncharacterized protein n=1 Tax=Puccinia sorghi TaxID=27349 RepID=A0A0L6UIK5_9BASI|nr:hypothetical protein VP01_589g1 [Puccinia sorghi]